MMVVVVVVVWWWLCDGGSGCVMVVVWWCCHLNRNLACSRSCLRCGVSGPCLCCGLLEVCGARHSFRHTHDVLHSEIGRSPSASTWAVISAGRGEGGGEGEGRGGAWGRS